MVQLPIFDEPAPTPVRPAPPRPTSAAPVYVRYKPKDPPKCDDCMWVQAQLRGHGPVSRLAQWVRRSGQDRLLLCHAHAAQRREADGLPALRGTS